MKKIVLFILTIASVFAFVGCKTTFTFGNYAYENSEKYTPFESAVDLGEGSATIQKLSLDWIAGEISVVEGDSLKISETNVKGTYYPLYYFADGETIFIRYCKSGTENKALNGVSKKLELTVPSSLSSADLDIGSANYTLSLGSLDKLDIDVGSGDGIVNVSSIGTFDLDAGSGNCTLLSTDVKKIDVDTGSGDISLTVQGASVLDSVTIDAGSANYTLTAGSVGKLDVDVGSGKGTVNVSSIDQFNLDAGSGNCSLHAAAAKELVFDIGSGDISLTVQDTSTLNLVKIDAGSGNAVLSFGEQKGYSLTRSTGSGKVTEKLAESNSPDAFSVRFHSTSGDLTIQKAE